MSDSRVFITGLGAVTPCGDTAAATWESILAGRDGIAEIQEWDISHWPCRLGGEIKNSGLAKMLPDRKLMKVISRQDVFGIYAAVQAINHSGMIAYRDGLDDVDTFNEDTGVYVGSPGNKYFQQYDFLPLLAQSKGNMQSFAKHLFETVHPMWLLRILPNNVLAYTGITYGFKGPNHNITNHAVGGTQAIIEAYNAIRTGQAKRAVVVAYDVGTEPQALFYYHKLGVISERHLKPFDDEHDGTLLAEAAAALVLESEDSVNERNAYCYGEILGGFAQTEGAGLFTVEQEGTRLAELITKTLSSLSLSDTSINMVVAHGNGNKKSDETEASAIAKTLGSTVPVTGFKWAMGHSLAASGLIDAVLTTYALRHHCVPGIANLKRVDESCQSINVQAQPRTLEEKSRALLINRGFASMNSCVVIQACE